MKRPSDERRQQLTGLRDRSLAVLRFISGSGSPNAAFLAQLENAINGAFDRGNLSGLRMVMKDMMEWAAYLPEQSKRELDDLLRSRYGSGLQESHNQTQREIQRILKRGTIESAEEYRLLVTFADEIHDEPKKQAQLKRINKLLSASKVQEGADRFEKM